MKKYFLGSVGKAEAFRNVNGQLELAFVSKTLTDSGLNISTTKDDIRGGQGAPIQFSFFHDPSVEITLTDIVFNREYITAQLGTPFSSVGAANNIDYITKETDTITSTGTYQLEDAVEPLPFPCDIDNKYVVWGTVLGENDYKIYEVDTATHKIVQGLTEGKKYCFRYLALSEASRVAELTSMIIPEELFLVITAPIFAGDACSASKGKAVGHITFEVPRFQLNGAQEFTMNMSSNQTMSLSGIALASDSANCDAEGGKLLRIIEVLNDRNWKEEITGILVDGETEVVDGKPILYAELKDGSLRKLSPADGVEFKKDAADYTPLLDGTKYAVGEYYFRLNRGTTEDPNYVTSEKVVIVAE